MAYSLIGIIEKFRDYLFVENGKAIIDLDVISENIGIPKEDILEHVSGEAELVEKVLDYERHRFEEIFSIHNFDGVNSIDILLTVSKEVAEKFIDISPSVTFVLKNHYPEIYHEHYIRRQDFIYENIKINFAKGINQGMFRSDLSIELIARLYLSRLIDLHNPDFFPAEKFSFETIFNAMFENHVRSIATPEGLAYYEQKKKNFNY